LLVSAILDELELLFDEFDAELVPETPETAIVIDPPFD
jgi:hypothetical protein